MFVDDFRAARSRQGPRFFCALHEPLLRAVLRVMKQRLSGSLIPVSKETGMVAASQSRELPKVCSQGPPKLSGAGRRGRCYRATELIRWLISVLNDIVSYPDWRFVDAASSRSQENRLRSPVVGAGYPCIFTKAAPMHPKREGRPDGAGDECHKAVSELRRHRSASEVMW